MSKKRSGPPPRIDTTHEIFYGAGYANDARVVYIDHRIPAQYTQRDGKRVDIHHYISIHEEIEKDLIDKFDMKYQEAHHIATAAERAALEADGYDWKQYTACLKPLLDACEQDSENVPADLDLTPYEDSKDTKTLRRIKLAQSKSGPAAGRL